MAERCVYCNRFVSAATWRRRVADLAADGDEFSDGPFCELGKGCQQHLACAAPATTSEGGESRC